MPRVVLQTVRGFVVADEALVSDELPRRSWKLKDCEPGGDLRGFSVEARGTRSPIHPRPGTHTPGPATDAQLALEIDAERGKGKKKGRKVAKGEDGEVLVFAGRAIPGRRQT